MMKSRCKAWWTPDSPHKRSLTCCTPAFLEERRLRSRLWSCQDLRESRLEAGIRLWGPVCEVRVCPRPRELQFCMVSAPGSGSTWHRYAVWTDPVSTVPVDPGTSHHLCRRVSNVPVIIITQRFLVLSEYEKWMLSSQQQFFLLWPGLPVCSHQWPKAQFNHPLIAGAQSR